MTDPTIDASDGHNAMTVASYEQCAVGYAGSTAPDPLHPERPLLQRLVERLPPGAHVLEIGSGPGWDADWLERAGLVVRRTDVTEAFLNVQRERGRTAERLDVITDPITGGYDAIVALYVFQHIERLALPAVFAKVSAALRAGGTLLFTILDGHGEEIEPGDDGRRYFVCRWTRDELAQQLAAAGLRLIWSDSFGDAEGAWLALMVERSGD
jgi:SAM-dependent methyltransferase